MKSSRWLSLIVLCIGFLLIVVDMTIVNVALPSIQKDLGFTQSGLAWMCFAATAPQLNGRRLATFNLHIAAGGLPRFFSLEWSMNTLDILDRLIAISVDSEKRYRHAARDVGRASLETFFNWQADNRKSAADELHAERDIHRLRLRSVYGQRDGRRWTVSF